jgi:Flp pilus assembly protein TadB
MEYLGKVLHELEISGIGDAFLFLITIASFLGLVASAIWVLIFHTVPMLIFTSVIGGLWLIDYFIKSCRQKYKNRSRDYEK